MTDLLAVLMTSIAALFDGTMGWAILALALAVRLALLPLTLHLSRKMLANQRAVKALQPQVDEIKQRLAATPKEMFSAISALYKQNGVHMVDPSSLMGALVQLPVFAVLYQAVSHASAGTGPFLWIRNLAAPDLLLGAIVLVLSAVSAYYFPNLAPDTATLMLVVQVLATAFILWNLSAGMGLYWAASAAVGVVQTFILRHEQQRMARAAAR